MSNGNNVIPLFSSATTPAVDLPSFPEDCTAQEAEVLCHSFRAIEALLDYIGGPNISNEMVARVDGLTNRARWRVECVKRMRAGE